MRRKSQHCRFITSAEPAVKQGARSVRYIFSTPAVARDGHTINQNGWDLSGFRKNPVFQWAHMDDEPPIGTVREIGLSGGNLCGLVEYVTGDLSPFAETVYQMVKRGIINAVSTAWLPLEWKYSNDPARRGGIDFIKQDLLEVSQVPVPAQSTAIATARAMGVNTQPFAEWAERQIDLRRGSPGVLAELCAARKAAMRPVLYRGGAS